MMSQDIIYGSDYGQPGIIHLYDPDYGQPEVVNGPDYGQPRVNMKMLKLALIASLFQ